MLTPINWALAEKLRARFLSDTKDGRDYWESTEAVELYDATFGARIAWKWDSIVDEMLRRQINVPPVILDWGAGTGIATRQFLNGFGGDISEVHLLDRSRLALDFAQGKIQKGFPNLKIATHTKEHLPTEKFGLLVSHVLGELSAKATKELVKLAHHAEFILWAEPGTPELSRQLIEIREELKSQFSVIAPCPHQLKCGMTTKENERHWCHFFAKPPQEVFHSAFWAEFNKKLKIDLRSLPVSFFAMQKPKEETKDGLPRVIGRARDFKGLVKALVCDPTGKVAEHPFVKSKHRELSEVLVEGTFQTEIEKTYLE